jgi:hypothetical protein
MSRTRLVVLGVVALAALGAWAAYDTYAQGQGTSAGGTSLAADQAVTVTPAKEGEAPCGKYCEAPCGKYCKAPCGKYGEAPCGKHGGAGCKGGCGTGHGGNGGASPDAN